MEARWLLHALLAALSLARLGCSLNAELFLRNKASRSWSTSRSDSLAKLLQRVARDHFDDCVTSVIYDPNFEQPIEFQRYFGSSSSSSYTQSTVDFLMARREGVASRQKCTNYVIFLYNILAMKHIMPANLGSKIVIVSAETPWEIKDFLKSHVSKMFMHLLVVVHSTSRRSGDGAYLLYTHKLYADGSGSAVPLLLGSWMNDGFRRGDESLALFPDKLKRGFMGHRLLVSTVENPPYTIRRTRWDGIEVRALRLSAAYLNFTVEFAEPQSASSRSPLEAAKRDVALGLASAAAGGIYETWDLGGSFDATSPFAEDCASFISLASTALPKYRAVLGPFQLAVWLMLTLSYLALIVPLTFNSEYSLLALLTRPSALNAMFWFVFSTYTNSFAVRNPLLRRGVAKNAAITVLLGVYWIFTIIITACYTGSIVAFITLPVYPSAMETAQELLYYKYRIGTLDHGGWETWFNVNTTDDPFAKRLFKRIEYVPTLLEGVQNASRAYFWPYAFLASKASLDYLVQTDFAPTWSTKRTLMHISDECFVRYNVVQLFPAKSLYTKPVSDFVTRATETGLLDQIVADIDWEIQRVAMMTNRQITKKVTNKVIIEDRILTVEDTQGMFLILGSGVLLALLALASESLASFWQKRKAGGDEADWQAQSRVDSWIVRDDPFRHRPSRGSV